MGCFNYREDKIFIRELLSFLLRRHAAMRANYTDDDFWQNDNRQKFKIIEREIAKLARCYPDLELMIEYQSYRLSIMSLEELRHEIANCKRVLSVICPPQNNRWFFINAVIQSKYSHLWNEPPKINKEKIIANGVLNSQLVDIDIEESNKDEDDN